MRKFDFGQPFQDRVLQLMLTNDEFLGLVSDRVAPGCFGSELCQDVAAALVDYHLKYRSAPRDLLLQELKKKLKEDSGPAEQYVGRLLKMEPVTNVQYVLDRIGVFVKTSRVADAIIEARELVADEQFGEAEEVVTKAFRDGRLEADLGYEYVEAVEDRVADREAAEPEENRVLTFIPKLDSRLGGLGRGELGVIFGPTGRGKTMGMVHMMKAALLQRLKVVFYTLEMADYLISERLDQSIACMTRDELRAAPKRLLKMVEMVKSLGGRAMICGYPSGSVTFRDLNAHMQSLVASGYIPDFVVVDYGDLLAPATQRDMVRHELADTFRGLRRIAGEYNVPVWTGSQSNRNSLNRLVVDVGDIAECFEKAGIADVLVSLCQTPEEEAAGEMRLFCAKNRSFGPKGWSVSVKQDFSRMQFAMREEEEEEKPKRKKRRGRGGRTRR